MVTFNFTRPTSLRRSSEPTPTPRPDFLRGSGRDDEFVRPLNQNPAASVFEQTIFDQLASRATRQETFLLIFTGVVTRPLTPTELFIYQGLFDGTFGGTVSTAAEALQVLQTVFAQFVAGPFDSGPAPDNSDFGGNDAIFGRGGNDTVIDLVGSNSVTTEDGDDWIRLGMGNDRVNDRGGNNDIEIMGGNNVVNTRDGDDRIVTGAGDDIINAYDGNNSIEAGDGDNIVRGGDGVDFVVVGTGEDVVNVGRGSLALDENGNPIPDDSPDGFLDAQTLVDLTPFGLNGQFLAHNVIIDQGGDDVLQSFGNSRENFPGLPDLVFNGDDLVISDLSLLTTAPDVPGDDIISLAGGDNLVIDYGGDNIVQTLEGDDFIFTSLVLAGDDEVSSGAGNDVVQTNGGNDTIRSGPGDDQVVAGTGADTVISGPGRDIILLGPGDGTGDGEADVSRVEGADVLLLNGTDPATIQAFAQVADRVFGFDGAGVDTIQFSSEFTAAGLGLGNVFALNAASIGLTFGSAAVPDYAVLVDVDGSNGFSVGDFFAAVLVDVPAPLTPGNFEFEAEMLV